ncbi:MAG TPA: sulfurtransferase-like selenium metabolism protein YedF [Candidatus Ozemobacteraceae bacterium]|nr:sulfurtransferase-like selenium metabolism protein YedF [Candidatus Ozemobacteraceae bacterium]
MSEKQIDARGLMCPKPLILVKKALGEMPPGGQIEVLLDNATARDNVVRFLQDYGCKPVCTETEGMFTLRTTVVTPPVAAPRPEEHCRPDGASRPYVLVLNRPFMGTGSEELGKILMQACINSIRETTPLPSAILFYNAGVNLACENSPVLPALRDLESRGIRMLVCGTCLDYFDLKQNLLVGRVSNMYDIMQTIASAGTVFAP